MPKARGIAAAAAASSSSPAATPSKNNENTNKNNKTTSKTIAPPLGSNRKTLPNIASAGLAMLVAGSYTPFDRNISHNKSNNKTSDSAVITNSTTIGGHNSLPPPMNEIATCWTTRSEACQVIRECNVMKQQKILLSQQQQQTAASEDSSSSISSSANTQVNFLGQTKIDVKLLLQFRNWILSLNDSNENNSNNDDVTTTISMLRNLLQGIPLSVEQEISVSSNKKDSGDDDDDDKKEKMKTTTTEEEFDLKSVNYETCSSWKILVKAAKKQVELVYEPFLINHGWLLKKEEQEEDDDDDVIPSSVQVKEEVKVEVKQENEQDEKEQILSSE